MADLIFRQRGPASYRHSLIGFLKKAKWENPEWKAFRASKVSEPIDLSWFNGTKALFVVFSHGVPVMAIHPDDPFKIALFDASAMVEIRQVLQDFESKEKVLVEYRTYS